MRPVHPPPRQWLKPGKAPDYRWCENDECRNTFTLREYCYGCLKKTTPVAEILRRKGEK